ncbi:hypothetical protein QJS10_CPA08g00738 [Acorus calamus]|uniref:Uncharacterized protein n=1 Tax=Acorus calamus TaxID=4465 RepID=A0AAV9EDW5_ACOCL|nr:hypothetical protein QJS10_CPA08g00738 [Acorus calamus]
MEFRGKSCPPDFIVKGKLLDSKRAKRREWYAKLDKEKKDEMNARKKELRSKRKASPLERDTFDPVERHETSSINPLSDALNIDILDKEQTSGSKFSFTEKASTSLSSIPQPIVDQAVIMSFLQDHHLFLEWKKMRFQ